MSLALYVHVPLCLSRCGYCDFATVAGESAVAISAALIGSLDALRGGLPGLTADTIYFGGGTPTALGATLPPVVARARAWSAGHLEEFTVETNPDTTDRPLVDRLLALGVDRFSLGVQSFDDKLLRMIGRRHSAQRARDTIADLKASGARVSIDLIAGIPGQSEESWTRDIETAVHSGVEHISIYPLTLSEDAPLFGRMSIDEDVAAERLEAAERAFTHAGFERYEIASFALKGQRSRHNLAYWSGVEYLGVGPSASSMLSAPHARTLFEHMGWTLGIPAGTHRVRFSMTCDIAAWLRDPLAGPEEVESLTLPEALREDLMLALRVADGASEALITQATEHNPGLQAALADVEALGLVEWAPHAVEPGNDVTQRLVLTERGWLLGNEVFGRIWNAG